MKKLRDTLLTILVTIVAAFGFCINSWAASATFSYEGDSSVKVGDEVTLTLYIKNISSGAKIVAAEGYISFDTSYLTFVSSSKASAPYSFSCNASNGYKFAGIDTSMEMDGITSNTAILIFKFTAVKAGTTSVTITDPKMSDSGTKFVPTVVAKSITITEDTPKSNDATLKSLGVTGYTLSPTFNSSTTAYTVSVPSTTTSVTLTGSVNDSKATVTGLGNVTLTGSTTNASVKVTAEDGSSKTYTVSIVKEAPVLDSDATLKSIGVTGYTLSPAFNSSTTTYTVNVPSTTTSVTLIGSANSTKATVTGLGNVTLTGNTTNASVKVTAENGSTKTYTVSIVKEAAVVLDSDATLKSLDVSGYTLTPSFSSATTSYTINVSNSITGLNVSAIPNKDTSSVSISGNTGWTNDVETITIKVTAEDGTVKNYYVNVIRPSGSSGGSDTGGDSGSGGSGGSDTGGGSGSGGSGGSDSGGGSGSGGSGGSDSGGGSGTGGSGGSDTGGGSGSGGSGGTDTGGGSGSGGSGGTDTGSGSGSGGSGDTGSDGTTSNSSDSSLKSLFINSAHSIEPSFSSSIYSYTMRIPNEVEQIDFTYITGNPNSKVTIIGNENFGIEIPKTVIIMVTSPDGNVSYYILNVTRSATKSETGLGGITVGGGSSQPTYNPSTGGYDVTVGSESDKVDVNANASSDGSSVEIIGNENLQDGNNLVLIKVTDSNGFSKYYKLNVFKESADTAVSTTNESTIPWYILGVMGFLILFLLLLILLLKKNKKEPMPSIEFKPEFNFGSKNTSDDDVVHGNMNQNSKVASFKDKEVPKMIEAKTTVKKPKSYDMYDETVTKDEIIDAIHEAMKTQDASKLKMLLDQDDLNKRKKMLKEQERRLN